MKHQYVIIWEKWHDPILNSVVENNTDTEDETEDYDEYLVPPEQNIKTSYKYPIIMTPMGFIPYNEKTSCEKTYNFWVGHTNFTITQQIAEILEKSDGTETLDIFTRYRFRIGIGRAFDDSQIMRNINQKVYSYLND